jgi:hypothetical protein
MEASFLVLTRGVPSADPGTVGDSGCDSLPAGIGINIDDPDVHRFQEPDGSVSYGGITLCPQPCISPLHTHDETGIIHTESASPEPNTLGQFFIVWGVSLSDSCVGEYSPEPSRVLRQRRGLYRCSNCRLTAGRIVDQCKRPFRILAVENPLPGSATNRVVHSRFFPSAGWTYLRCRSTPKRTRGHNSTPRTAEAIGFSESSCSK